MPEPNTDHASFLLHEEWHRLSSRVPEQVAAVRAAESKLATLRAAFAEVEQALEALDPAFLAKQREMARKMAEIRRWHGQESAA